MFVAGAAHLRLWFQSCTDARATRRSENCAAVVVRKLYAASAGRFAVWHARNRRANRQGDAAGATTLAASVTAGFRIEYKGTHGAGTRAVFVQCIGSANHPNFSIATRSRGLNATRRSSGSMILYNSPCGRRPGALMTKNGERETTFPTPNEMIFVGAEKELASRIEN